MASLGEVLKDRLVQRSSPSIMDGMTGDGVEAGIVEVDGVLVVAFRCPGSGSTIEFPRSLGDPDPRDVAGGMDTYGICVDAAGVVYGGVEGWDLAGDTFAFTLTEEAAATLGTEREHTLLIGHGPDERALAEGLERVLGVQEVRPGLTASARCGWPVCAS